ncbi:MAG: hypothetical protein QXK06_03985 [Candidatus Diapherotrites archaeon]
MPARPKPVQAKKPVQKKPAPAGAQKKPEPAGLDFTRRNNPRRIQVGEEYTIEHTPTFNVTYKKPVKGKVKVE